VVLIKTEINIHSSIEKVWDIISNLDSEPKFWKGTKEIRNISKEGNKITREITIAFRDAKCMQEVLLQPKEKIQFNFIDGVIKGTKTIELEPAEEGTNLQTIWDIKLSGMMGIFSGMVKKHIKNGTEQALENIKQEAER